MSIKVKTIGDDIRVRGWGKLRWPRLFLDKASDDEIYTTEEASKLAGYKNGAPSTSNLLNMMSKEQVKTNCLHIGSRYYWGTKKAVQMAHKKLVEEFGETDIGLGRIDHED